MTNKLAKLNESEKFTVQCSTMPVNITKETYLQNENAYYEIEGKYYDAEEVQGRLEALYR